jgi:hypothetical protein
LHGLELNLMALQQQDEDYSRQHRRAQSVPFVTPTTFPGIDTAATTGTTTPMASQYGSILNTREEELSPIKPNKDTPKFDNRKDYPVPPPPPPNLPPPPLLSSSSPSSNAPSSKPPRYQRAKSAAAAATSSSPLIPILKHSNSSRRRISWQHGDDSPSLLPMVVLDAGGLSLSQNHRKSSMIPTSTRITHSREPILDQIYAARNRLRETTQYAQHVAAQALVFDDTEDQFPDKDKTPASEFTTTQRISSFLNLCSCFLYMTNYYVVAPTVGDYSVQLGSSEAMAGIIIGMTPNAALIATVLYGWWSNHSYRHALIFAACSSVLGNIFYALALKYNSLNMVMIGRFFNGFGR